MARRTCVYCLIFKKSHFRTQISQAAFDHFFQHTLVDCNKSRLKCLVWKLKIWTIFHDYYKEHLLENESETYGINFKHKHQICMPLFLSNNVILEVSSNKERAYYEVSRL